MRPQWKVEQTDSMRPPHEVPLGPDLGFRFKQRHVELNSSLNVWSHHHQCLSGEELSSCQSHTKTHAEQALP